MWSLLTFTDTMKDCDTSWCQYHHSKRLAYELYHNVHIMVQNSMGSDLFLDLMATFISGLGGGNYKSIGTGNRNIPPPKYVERKAENAVR